MNRSRVAYAATALVVVALGLGTRPLKRYADAAGSAVGDALWAVLVYLLIALVFPRLRSAVVAVMAMTVAVVVEASQLWHFGWLDAARSTTFGKLSIGGSFSVTDLVCYAVGIGGVFAAERWRATNPPRSTTLR